MASREINGCLASVILMQQVSSTVLQPKAHVHALLAIDTHQRDD